MPHAYPTTAHSAAADAVVDYFKDRGYVDAVLLTNSCARGKATPDSCLDMAVLVQPHVAVAEIEKAWDGYYRTEDVFEQLKATGRYAEVHLKVITGDFKAGRGTWTGPPDPFELEIGNYLAYSVPLCQRNDRYVSLRAKWLPYYNGTLRAERLAMVRENCLNNIDHIPLYIARELYFQSFNRLYEAYRKFLQALFIKQRTYPIAYDKWIREQVVDILELPELYAELPALFEIRRFESHEIAEKAVRLADLLELYAPAE